MARFGPWRTACWPDWWVASSCAIPGYFPTVSHAGERYMDAARGPRYHTGIVKELALDSALFIGRPRG